MLEVVNIKRVFLSPYTDMSVFAICYAKNFNFVYINKKALLFLCKTTRLFLFFHLFSQKVCCNLSKLGFGLRGT